MPVVQSLMDNLVRQYGAAKGRSVYYAMEAEGSGPFAKGGKHHDLHVAFTQRNHVPPIGDRGPGKKKGRQARRARRP